MAVVLRMLIQVGLLLVLVLILVGGYHWKGEKVSDVGNPEWIKSASHTPNPEYTPICPEWLLFTTPEWELEALRSGIFFVPNFSKNSKNFDKPQKSHN